MGWECIVHVMGDAMIVFSRGVRRVDVNDRVFEIRQGMQQLMPRLDRDGVALRYREIWAHRDIDFAGDGRATGRCQKSKPRTPVAKAVMQRATKDHLTAQMPRSAAAMLGSTAPWVSPWPWLWLSWSDIGEFLCISF
jgi:hypothetical protein